ncbi:hypothetical protein E4U13_002302 [Claviceps humidiphila]|uniref:DNA-directed RNA polymerase III subunit RPC9 n=2 Tax=Claviceps TaxID=5110 RepID=A0A9P7STF9_9HYPO|nr:hypothetical protein E4U57_000893 [Claviceps arundinis]KAG6023014.1 hypothetical protein E4U19_004641 [Claviceps sp. Clav32 group G5]KAG6037376.1 hypothetical protein E4U40_005551 [Claviceps sp. LM458 group G5]KAG6049325.1 hypothetical protein E4U39_006212 [Claviceps sp. Clav50 group G5]KAG6064992.1 hypothetical protein E4U32_007868 [Claviceps aff. humidiphila group G2b]KAG6112905.1 hypothetical protein E4U31_002124 [Claviceps sp. LM219 group G6]KAG6123673.1 hypothetical protein E4U13_0023
MKIIEAQSAVLSDYEVYQHLSDQRNSYKQNKRRGPPNMETVVRELLQYLRTEPNPLSQQPLTYTPDCIAQLLEKLRPYELSKGEVVMVLNLRPASVAGLNTIIEDMSERFSEEQQEDMVNIVAQVLGRFDVPEEENGDVEMDDAGAS